MVSKPIGNVPPLGLSAEAAKAVHRAVDREMDELLEEGLREARQRDPARAVAAEREFVDAVRRWAARREEELFPSGRRTPAPDETAECRVCGGFLHRQIVYGGIVTCCEVCEADDWKEAQQAPHSNGVHQRMASCVSCGYKGPHKPGCAVGARRWREYDSGLTLLCERCWDKYPAGYPG